MYSEGEIEQAAQAIVAARRDRAEVGLASGLPRPDRDDAYRIQDRVGALLAPDAQRIGFKASIGADGAVVAGPLWGHRLWESGVELDGRGLRQLGVETEVCLRLGVARRRGRGTTVEIVGALPALEIIERRTIEAGEAATELLIADGLYNHGVVLGEETRGWSAEVLGGLAGVWRNGEPVAERPIKARLPDPHGLANGLARLADQRGWAIPDGALLMTGLLTEVVWLEPGDAVAGEIGPLGPVSASLRA